MHYDSSDDEDKKLGLGKKFFLQLLEDERKVNTKIESMQQILDLLDKYAKCVEFFDTLGNPARHYFMEKISNTIAEQKSYEIILQDEKKAREKREKEMIIKPIIKEGQVKYDPLKRPEKIKPKIDATPQKIDEETETKKEENKKISRKLIRDARAKKLTMTEKIYQQQEQNDASLHLIKQWDEEVAQNDQLIQQQLRVQEKEIQDRITERLNRLRKQMPSNITSEISFDQLQYDT